MNDAVQLQAEEAEIFRRLDALVPKPLDKDLAEVAAIEANKVSLVRNGKRRFKARELDRVRPWLDRLEARTAAAAHRLPDVLPTRASDAGDIVDIVSLDLTFSMGPGTNIDDYIEETPYRFDLAFIRTFTRSETSRLRLAHGVGESMFPTLVSSDLVWIDTTQRTLNQQDRIWAISLFGAAAIKRLRTIGEGKVLVISDNPAVENQTVDAEDLVIGGRVIRLGRDV